MMIFAELTRGPSDQQEVVLVFPAHLANFTRLNWNWKNPPLPLVGGHSNRRVFIIREPWWSVGCFIHSCSSLKGTQALPFVTSAALVWAAVTETTAPPVECCRGFISWIFQVWRLISYHPVPQTSRQWLLEVSHSCTDLLHSCWGLYLLVVSTAHMWYPPPRRCSVKCFLNEYFDDKTSSI